ncbi:hypothetical protein ADUPG1_007783, partial [Aduncisulcus paluster]
MPILTFSKLQTLFLSLDKNSFRQQDQVTQLTRICQIISQQLEHEEGQLELFEINALEPLIDALTICIKEHAGEGLVHTIYSTISKLASELGSKSEFMVFMDPTLSDKYYFDILARFTHSSRVVEDVCRTLRFVVASHPQTAKAIAQRLKYFLYGFLNRTTERKRRPKSLQRPKSKSRLVQSNTSLSFTSIGIGRNIFTITTCFLRCSAVAYPSERILTWDSPVWLTIGKCYDYGIMRMDTKDTGTVRAFVSMLAIFAELGYTLPPDAYPSIPQALTACQKAMPSDKHILQSSFDFISSLHSHGVATISFKHTLQLSWSSLGAVLNFHIEDKQLLINGIKAVSSQFIFRSPTDILEWGSIAEGFGQIDGGNQHSITTSSSSSSSSFGPHSRGATPISIHPYTPISTPHSLLKQYRLLLRLANRLLSLARTHVDAHPSVAASVMDMMRWTFLDVLMCVPTEVMCEKGAEEALKRERKRREHDKSSKKMAKRDKKSSQGHAGERTHIPKRSLKEKKKKKSPTKEKDIISKDSHQQIDHTLTTSLTSSTTLSNPQIHQPSLYRGSQHEIMVERDGKILLKKRRRRSDRVKSSSSSTAGSKSKSKSRRSSNNKHDYPPSPTYDAFTGASRVLAAESIDFS